MREELSFEELMARSSVGGATDPALEDICTEDEARTFAAGYSGSQTLPEDPPSGLEAGPRATLSDEEDSEVRRVEMIRDLWSDLATYVERHVCDDRVLMAGFMHEAAATFTQYWRDKGGDIDREHALAVLQRAARLHGRQGRYEIDIRKEIEASLIEHD
jgi:hypothetical protein